MNKYQKDMIYISKVDHCGRMWLWKCSKDSNQTYHRYRLLINKDGRLDYEEKKHEDHHGWEENILATPEEANWLEQCIKNPSISQKNLKDIPTINTNYEIY